jgi:hypothetical protein
MCEITTTKVLSIRECGHDEQWLGDRICDDPSKLGLGDLRVVSREKMQSSGARLDLLLEDPEDESMYEVELQLGTTNETHIIRTIEYWDNEKRRRPRRSHTAVLVAEDINNRFFNVAYLLSLAVPLIGIRASIIQIGDVTGLHFAKVLDTYQEPEDDGTEQQTYDEKHWKDNYPATLECARWYRDLLAKFYGEIPIKYFGDYITLRVGGTNRVWVRPRKNEITRVSVKYVEESYPEAVGHLNKEGMAFEQRRGTNLWFYVSLQQLKEKQAVHEWIVQRIAPEYRTKSNPQ